MKIFDSLVASNIRQRPLRSAISIVGVALGVALVMIFTRRVNWYDLRLGSNTES